MKEIIIIGTIHLNSTPKEELCAVLQGLKPDKLLIELSPEELQNRDKGESIRDEMFAAYEWAITNHIDVSVFDDNEDILKAGVTGLEPEFLEYELEVKKILAGYSWKDLNKKEPWEIPEVVKRENRILELYFDVEKRTQRDVTIAKNITAQLIEGRNVVITGAGHITNLKETFPNAVLPFRS